MPTYEEALKYLGIDYPDEVVEWNVTRSLAAAARTLQGAVGTDVFDLMPDDGRVKELILIYTDDLYSVRGTAAKVSNATRRCVAAMELQVRLDLRAKREEAGA